MYISYIGCNPSKFTEKGIDSMAFALGRVSRTDFYSPATAQQSSARPISSSGDGKRAEAQRSAQPVAAPHEVPAKRMEEPHPLKEPSPKPSTELARSGTIGTRLNTYA